jgi:hypothetical protein
MRPLGVSFHEIMEGTLQREGERFDRPFRFEFRVETPRLVGMLGVAKGSLEGTVRLDGVARDAPAKGTVELSPFWERRMRYVFDFTGADAASYRFDGKKTILPWQPLRTITTLPGMVSRGGEPYGVAVLRFSFARHLPDLVRSIRLRWDVPAHA